MGAVMEVPVWLAALVCLAAAVAVLDRLVAPSFRWVMRRRLERAVERLNQRLSLRIQPFKLLNRSYLIERLAHDPEVMRAVEAHLAETGMPRDIAHRQVVEFAREIAPAFSAMLYFGVGARICRWAAEALYRIRLGAFDRKALQRIDPEAAVVFVINHRSNVDYLLVTHLASGAATISYAVGEWARFWPLAPLIRAMGAYFIRRRERGPLYRAVLRRYVQMAVEGGVTQAVFLEGGLSRDGGLGSPKLGLLAYLAEGSALRDAIFVPVGVNYDHVLEDRTLLSAYGPHGAGRFDLRPFATFRAISLWALRGLFRRRERFGVAAVGFGAPLSARDWAKGGGDVEALGDELMRRIGLAVPVPPAPLVAAIFAEEGGPIPREEAARRAVDLAERLRAAGAHVVLPAGRGPGAAEAGIAELAGRGLLVERPAGLTPTDTALIAYYARSIAHLPRAPGAPAQ